MSSSRDHAALQKDFRLASDNNQLQKVTQKIYYNLPAPAIYQLYVAISANLLKINFPSFLFAHSLSNEQLVAGLHVPKKRFFLAVLFERFFFFLLTQREKRAFSHLKAFISGRSAKEKRAA